MTGIDITQMVRSTAPPADRGTSVDKGLSAADRQNTGFLQMLRGKQQAAERREGEERLSQKDGAYDKDDAKEKMDAGQDDESSGQILSEAGAIGARDIQAALIFRIQAEAVNGTLQEAWDPALAGVQEAGAEIPEQSLIELADSAETAGEQAWPVLPEEVSSEDLTSMLQEAQTDAAAQDMTESPKAVQEPVHDRSEDNMFQAYAAGETVTEQEETPEVMFRTTGLQDSEVTENKTEFHEQLQEQETGQDHGWSETEISPDKAMHPNQAAANDNLRTQMPVRAEAPVRTTEAQLPADLGKAIADRMPANDGTLTIELEPASLGKVIMKVIYEGGRASISLMSANEKTLEILNQNASQIAGILEDKTGKETVIYTYQPEQQNADPQEGGGKERREPQEQKDSRKREQPDSFAQQLRLGLV